jgi:hypothetical protein
MAKDWRIVDQAGRRLPFTCENRRYKTNIEKKGSFPHGPHPARGSVTQNYLLVAVGSLTLWLEHVVDKSDDDNECYWLMWYDANGNSTIPLSGVFWKPELAEMAKQLMQFVP